MISQRRIVLLALSAVGGLLALVPIAGHYTLHPKYERRIVADAEEMAQRVGRHMADSGFVLLRLHGDAGAVAAEQARIERLAQSFELRKVRVFDAAGAIVYSSKAEEIGTANRSPYFREIVARGGIFSKVVRSETPTLEGEIAARDVAEVYVPLFHDAVFVGAFEIYLDITAEIAGVNAVSNSNRTLVFTVSGLFILATGLLGVWVSRELTRREVAEAGQRDLFEQLRAITDSTLDAVILIDNDGRVAFWNPAATAIFGHPRDKAMGRDVHDLIAAPRFREMATEAFPAFRETGHGPVVGKTVELVGLRKSGEEFPVELTLNALRIRERWWAVGIARDVTRRKEDEAARRTAESQTARARRIEALGMVSAGVAHEFNNLLLPILTLSEMTLRDQPEGSRGRVRLEKVVEACHKAKRLVGVIGEMRRVSETASEPRELAAALDEAIERVGPLLPSSLTLSVEDGVRACATRIAVEHMEAILLQLGKNAADALGGRSGHLVLSGEDGVDGQSVPDAIPTLAPGRYVRLSFADDGPGMTPNVLEHAMDPFFTTSEVGGGLGVGLTIVHNVVAGLGGGMRIDSAPGKGCRVDLFLPRRAGA